MVPTAVHLTNFIAGRFGPARAGGKIEVVNPATEDVIAVVDEATPADVDAAVAAAVEAFPRWSATPPSERADFLRRLAAALTGRADELARLIATEVGSPLAFARSTQVGLPIKVLEGMADVVDDYAWDERIGPSIVVREAAGVAGAIAPWNYPLHQVVAKVAAALGAGCTVVVKPSEVAPLSAYVLAEVLDELQLPPGVGNVITGYGPVVGEALAAHRDVDVVSLTGSPAAGRRIMELAAPLTKKVTLELGGKSATIVLDDVEMEAVIPASVIQCVRNAGQNCSALSRLLVPRAHLSRVEELAAAAAAAVVVGDPLDPATQMGPVVSALQRDRVLAHVARGLHDGARLIAGGLEPPPGMERGYFVRPTVFSSVDANTAIAQDEIFGPVLCVIAYDDEDDAIFIANNSRYGLAGAVWSADRARAERVARKMRTGRVTVNGGEFNALAPFGGYRQSGIGRELGRFGLEEYLETKTLQC